VAFSSTIYSTISFTATDAAMVVPAAFSTGVQSASLSFICVDDCPAIVFEGEQFVGVPEGATVNITSAGDILFQGNAFYEYSGTGDITIAAAGSLTFGGVYSFKDLVLDETYSNFEGDILVSAGGDLIFDTTGPAWSTLEAWKAPDFFLEFQGRMIGASRATSW